MVRTFAALRSLLYGSVFLGLWGWLALQTRPFDRAMGTALPSGATIAGYALMLLGGLLVVACVASFVGAGRGTPAPFDPPRVFVAVGPYRWVRNPMYLGGFALLLGFGLWHRSVAMAAFAGLFVTLAHLFVVLYEEPSLLERFGEVYGEYSESVNRWVPRSPTAA